MPDDLTGRAIIAAHNAQCVCVSKDQHDDYGEYRGLTKCERAIVEALRADVERLGRYQRLDLIHMQNQLRMIHAVGEALGIDQNDADACVPGCDEGAGGLEHDLHHLIERDAARGAAIERVRAMPARSSHGRVDHYVLKSDVLAALEEGKP